MAANATGANAVAEPEPRAAHVIEALCRVMRDLPSIQKGGTADPKQGGYRYRGIEQITPHTQRLFAQHGVLFAPRVVRYELRELMVNNKPWTDVVEEVEYDVYGPGGPADKIVVGPLLAIGRDNSDKGGNKCLTQAMKYALLQVFQVSDPADDADGTTHEADERTNTSTLADNELTAKDAKGQLLHYVHGDKDAASAAWTAAGLDGQWKVTEKDLDRAKHEYLTVEAMDPHGSVDLPPPADGEGAEPTSSGSAPEPVGANTDLRQRAEAIADMAAGEGS